MSDFALEVSGAVPASVPDPDRVISALTDSMARLEVSVRRVSENEIRFRVPLIRMEIGLPDVFVCLDVGHIVVRPARIEYRAGLVRALVLTIVIWSALAVLAHFQDGPVDRFSVVVLPFSFVLTLVWIYLYAASALPRFIRKVLEGVDAWPERSHSA